MHSMTLGLSMKNWKMKITNTKVEGGKQYLYSVKRQRKIWEDWEAHLKGKFKAGKGMDKTKKKSEKLDVSCKKYYYEW